MQQAAAPPADVSDSSYEADFVLWSERQARLPRVGRPGELDLVHPVEEVENSCRDEIESRLTVPRAHLLKWKHQPGNRSRRWEATLIEQRRRIARVFRRAPSLRAHPQKVSADGHLSGRLDAGKDTGMDFTLFPTHPPLTLAQVLDLNSSPVEPDREARV